MGSPCPSNRLEAQTWFNPNPLREALKIFLGNFLGTNRTSALPLQARSRDYLLFRHPIKAAHSKAGVFAFSLPFHILPRYPAEMPVLIGTRQALVKCKVCGAQIPSLTKGVPVLPARVPCGVCGTRQVYRPSEVFIGSLPQIWKHERRSADHASPRKKSRPSGALQRLQALYPNSRRGDERLSHRCVSRLHGAAVLHRLYGSLLGPAVVGSMRVLQGRR